MRKIIIVGGVAGGATAATRLRRLNEDLEITMFEKGGYVSFANCGLPYHVSDLIPERKKLLLQSPESFKSRYNVDTKICTEVLKIDRDSKKVQVQNLNSGEIYEESYDTLLLSPGAEPNLPPIQGIEKSNYHFMRSIEDLDGLMFAIKEKEQKSPKNALVIGGGFIGLEVAENLVERNMSTYLVEAAAQVMMSIDTELAAIIHKELIQKGVTLHLETTINKIETEDNRSKVYLSNGQILHVDVILLATGVRPRTKLAVEAGLTIGKKGGIEVNEYFQTNDPDIFAVGDAIEINHLVNGKPAIIPLAWLANRQGRLVADNMLGARHKPFKGGLGTSIVKIFDLTVASTGLNERFLRENDIPYQVATINRLDHAGYYPDAQDIILKLLFTKEGKILGAQGIGPKSVDKRIDIIATAIQTGLSVYDLQEIEIAYAPPYNSAKDPVNILGYLAENMLTGLVKQVEIHQLEYLLSDNNYALLDVRTPVEFQEGTILGSENIELDVLRENLHKLDKEKTYIVFCRVGFRSYNACRILTNNGFKAVNLNGGYTLWEPSSRRFHFHNYIGIDIESHHFEVAVVIGKEIVRVQQYPNSRLGCQHLIKNLEELHCSCKDSLFYIKNNTHSSTHLYQYLGKQSANIWLCDTNNNIVLDKESSAKELVKYAMKYPTKARIFEPPREVKQQLQLLVDSKNKLTMVKNTLTVHKKGEHISDNNNYTVGSQAFSHSHRFYLDTLNALELDLNGIDAKIDTLWSLSVSVNNTTPKARVVNNETPQYTEEDYFGAMI